MLRDAYRDDVHAIVAMLADDVLGAAREMVKDPPDPAYLAAFDRIAASPGDPLVVALSGGAHRRLRPDHGTARPQPARGEPRALEAARVASDLRGAGLGAALVAELVATARRAGCTMVQLTSDASSAYSAPIGSIGARRICASFGLWRDF